MVKLQHKPIKCTAFIPLVGNYFILNIHMPYIQPIKKDIRHIKY